MKELPRDLTPVMRFAYLTGWRVPSEVLPLTWDRVDFRTGMMWLERGTTKTDEPRRFPFSLLPALKDLLDAQREHTSAVERETGRIIPNVFHRNGKPIRDFYKAWRSAQRRAAMRSTDGTLLAVVVRPHLLGRLAHDFRRTAVRNLVRAGVNEQLAMRLTGHKTRAIFDRYDITNDDDLRAGVSKLSVYLSQPPQASRGTSGGQSPLRVVSGGQ